MVTVRKRRGFSPSKSTRRERPKEDWIEITVPSIVSNDTFDLAQERLEKNKQFSPRHTKEPSLLQGLLCCSVCGCSFRRASAWTSSGKTYYYRCKGTDGSLAEGRICSMRYIRQDYLDELVWQQTMQLLESPEPIHKEINRRMEEARNSNPTGVRKETLEKEISRVQKGIDRLIDVYQDGLLEREEFSTRIKELRKKDSILKSELQSLDAKMIDQEQYLQLGNNIDAFLARIRKSADSLNMSDKQKVLRSIVAEILVGPDTITIKHSIPTAPRSSLSTPASSGLPTVYPSDPDYLLRRRSNDGINTIANFEFETVVPYKRVRNNGK